MCRDPWFLATTKKERETMLNHIKTLLSDVQLQQQVKKATNLTEVIKLIMTAGVAKGYNFSKGGVIAPPGRPSATRSWPSKASPA